jgi:hypothetical protein
VCPWTSEIHTKCIAILFCRELRRGFTRDPTPKSRVFRTELAISMVVLVNGGLFRVIYSCGTCIVIDSPLCRCTVSDIGECVRTNTLHSTIEQDYSGFATLVDEQVLVIFHQCRNLTANHRKHEVLLVVSNVGYLSFQ